MGDTDWFIQKKKEWVDWIDEGLRSNDAAIRSSLQAWAQHHGAWADYVGAAADIIPTAATQCGLIVTDIARLGEGAKKGGVLGWGNDGLRLLSVVPVTRVVQWVRLQRLARIAQVADQPYCTYVNMAKGINLGKGQVIYASVADFCRDIGIEEHSLGGATVEEVSNLLKRTKLAYKLLPEAKSVGEIIETIKGRKGVMVFSLKGAPHQPMRVPHTIIGLWDWTRKRVVFIGRGNKVLFEGNNLSAVSKEFHMGVRTSVKETLYRPGLPSEILSAAPDGKMLFIEEGRYALHPDQWSIPRCVMIPLQVIRINTEPLKGLINERLQFWGSSMPQMHRSQRV